jgi:hypothetical protein
MNAEYHTVTVDIIVIIIRDRILYEESGSEINILVAVEKWFSIFTYLGVCDYRRAMDWLLDLLTTYRSYYKQL